MTTSYPPVTLKKAKERKKRREEKSAEHKLNRELATSFVQTLAKKVERIKIKQFVLHESNSHGYDLIVIIHFQYRDMHFTESERGGEKLKRLNLFEYMRQYITGLRSYMSLSLKQISNDKHPAQFLIHKLLKTICKKKEHQLLKEANLLLKSDKVAKAVKSHHLGSVKSILKVADLTKEELCKLYDEVATEDVVGS